MQTEQFDGLQSIGDASADRVRAADSYVEWRECCGDVPQIVLERRSFGKRQPMEKHHVCGNTVTIGGKEPLPKCFEMRVRCFIEIECDE